MRITVDAKKCVGCRTCELVCGYHHSGQFNPELSSIKINFDYNFNLSITVAEDCNCSEEPMCMTFCPVLEAIVAK